MIQGFESYTLNAWSDVDGLMLTGKVRPASVQHRKAKRSGAWSTIVSVGVGAVCLGISSFLFADLPSGVAIPALAYDLPDIEVAKPQVSQNVAISPIREINRSFNNLFDSVRAGEALIPSEEIRALARRALESQKANEEIEPWAQKLAADIKDADD